MIPILYPFEKVGSFLLRENIECYKSKFNFVIVPGKDDLGAVYSVTDLGISLSLDLLGNIEFIICKQELIFHGINLIKISINQLESILGATYVGAPDVISYESDNVPQYIYEFESHGLQVWEKNGLIAAIIVGLEEDE